LDNQHDCIPLSLLPWHGLPCCLTAYSSLYIGAIGTGFAPGYISHANPFLLLENSSATYSPRSAYIICRLFSGRCADIHGQSPLRLGALCLQNVSSTGKFHNTWICVVCPLSRIFVKLALCDAISFHSWALLTSWEFTSCCICQLIFV
jgi:hypothetical protein